jgi:hypothetical protein
VDMPLLPREAIRRRNARARRMSERPRRKASLDVAPRASTNNRNPWCRNPRSFPGFGPMVGRYADPPSPARPLREGLGWVSALLQRKDRPKLFDLPMTVECCGASAPQCPSVKSWKGGKMSKKSKARREDLIREMSGLRVLQKPKAKVWTVPLPLRFFLGFTATVFFLSAAHIWLK